MKNFKTILFRSGAALLLCIAVMLSSCIMPLAASLVGDINADSALTAEDLTLVRKALLSGTEDTAYDINGDGDIDVRDLVNLKKKIAYYVDGEKFTANEITEIGNADAVILSELFTANDGAVIDSSLVKVEIDTGDSGVTHSEYTVDAENWANTPIWFYGTGTVTVTVYEYCKPTSITVNVVNEVKFEPIKDVAVNIADNATVTLGELFTQVKDVTVDSSKVEVTTENGAWTPDTSDWTKGTITFTTVGTYNVTIKEVSEVSTTTVNVINYYNGEKFAVNFPNVKDYLYRVGNANTVALGSLFKAKDGVTVVSGDVEVSVTAVSGNAKGTYTSNETDWKAATIQFTGTGVAEITISENSNPTTLTVEVVDATNVTEYSKLGNRNSVLLNDITMSSGSSYYLSGATLYGNGFTFDVTDGAYNSSGYLSGNYLISLTNATLDNIKIIGAVYTEYGATRDKDYNRALVFSAGNNTIYNSYLSNCAAPVRVNGGNLEIINSTIKGGNFANIDIRGGHVVLDGVTTINQVNGNDTAEDGTVVVGLGVVVYYENVLDTTTVEIKNGITQYNNLSEAQADTYITDSTASTLVSEMFESTYSSLQYNDGSDIWINTGIISMIGTVGDDNISDVDGYDEANPEMNGVTGYVHTKTPDVTSIAATVPEYATAGQGAIAPAYSFDYTTKNYVAKADGSNDYCYEDNGTVLISMDEGDTFNWDTAILTATKSGTTLGYTVSMNGTDYTGKSIAFNTAGNYTVAYTYTDSNNYMIDENGNIATYEVEYTKNVHINVAVIKAAAKNAEFTFGSSNASTEKITVDNNTYISATGVTADNSSWSYITVNGQKIYYPIVEATIVDKKIAYFNVFKNIVSITDYADGGTGSAVVYNSSTTTMPSGLTVVKGKYGEFTSISSTWSTLTDSALTQSGASNVFKYASSSSASETPTTYNGALCFASPEVSNARVEYYTIVQYSYTDSTNTTYYYYVGYHMAEKGKYTGCVTPDTLVTLADGSQKSIDSVTNADQLLVWNFVTGEYDSVPASIVMNHGYDNYTVVTLNFEDGTTVKTIGGHGFFDTEANEFILLDENNVADYVGHTFVKQNGDGYSTTKLVDYSITTEYTESWSILTAVHHNAIVEGMWSLTAAEVDDSPKYLMPFTVGEDMKYDEAAMQADIEKYGLYTYEEFAEHMTYEQFVALNLSTFKVAVGKGYITYDEIMYLIDIHIKK